MNMDINPATETKKVETKLAKHMTWDTIHTAYDPQYVLSEADRELKNTTTDEKNFSRNTNIYKACTLKEFDNGILLCESVKEEYRTFVIDLSRNIQKEYNCTTASQKATAESISCSYGRMLQLSAKIARRLDIGSLSELDIKYLAVLSKELDRTQRHYVTALQTLFMLKQPPLNITVKANTANIANSQLIQQNHIVKPI